MISPITFAIEVSFLSNISMLSRSRIEYNYNGQELEDQIGGLGVDSEPVRILG